MLNKLRGILYNPLISLVVAYFGPTPRLAHASDISQQSQNKIPEVLGKSRQRAATRGTFWKFCSRTAARTRLVRLSARGTLTAHDIDKLFVDQKWRCAISGIKFDAPELGRGRPGAFAPSLDRINSGGKYEVGNIRLVCTIVNFAMNEWGEEALHRLVREMSP